MPEPMGEDRQVKFAFEYDPDYRLISANGTWSGFTPRGDFRIDFFAESMEIPEYVTHLVTPAGQLGAELSRSESKIVRRVQFGVLLSVDQAEAAVDYIKGQITQFRQQQGREGR